jgi:hypothetical protein
MEDSGRVEKFLDALYKALTEHIRTNKGARSFAIIWEENICSLHDFWDGN